MTVRNPGPQFHRVLGTAFPVGEAVSVDEELGKHVIEQMGFEEVKAAKPIADGSPVTKPAKGVRK